MSDQPQSLASALAELQQHLPRIGKDAQGQRSRYASLEEINRVLLPLLGARGFSFSCVPTMVDGQFVLEHTLRWSGTGEMIRGYYPLPSSTPQTMGGAITYARRYGILAVTGATQVDDPDDDDAQAAEQAARAQRNMPPEVREDGSATEAELTRMTRGHEPGAWRATSTAENDPFYDQVASMDDWPPENQPGSSSKEQRQSIYIALGRRGIKDHATAINRLIRCEITDPRDMSHNEATAVLARVRSWDGRTEELLASLVQGSQADA